MGLFSWLGGFFYDGSAELETVTDFVSDDNVVNPANGLPMIGGMGGVDVEGNIYSTDSINDLSCASTIDMFEGCISDFSSDSCSSGLDDSFSSFGSNDW